MWHMFESQNTHLNIVHLVLELDSARKINGGNNFTIIVHCRPQRRRAEMVVDVEKEREGEEDKDSGPV